MIERGSGVAVWRQIEQSLTQEITEGVLTSGQKLPTETELAQRFNVNRHTIRHAVAALESRGLVRVEQGRGTYVQEHAIRYNVGKRTRFSESLRRQNLEASHRLLRGLELPAPSKVAEALEIAAGSRIVLLETLGEADGRPINVSSHYFAAKRFPELIEVYRSYASITKTLRHYGIEDYTRSSSRITARLPEADVARWLQQPKTRPILQVEGINVDAQGKALEFGITRFAGDWVQLVVDDDGLLG